MSVYIHQAKTVEDFQHIYDLQIRVWGSFGPIPVNMLLTSSHNGGACALAWVDDTPVGFVISMPCQVEGTYGLWSYRLGVLSGFRDQHIGLKLKEFQRQFCLDHDISTVFWTYDPLESRNANFNLNKLGAEVVSYNRDFYERSESILHTAIGTDRFIVRWDVQASFKTLLSRETLLQMPIVNYGHSEDYIEDDRVRLEIPSLILELKETDPQKAYEWRLQTRALFELFLQTHEVETLWFDREEKRSFYILKKKGVS